MTIRAGILTDWSPGGSNSMAKEIEAELLVVAPLAFGEDPVGRRKLCVAIARGVVKYLRAQQTDIRVIRTSDNSVITSRGIDLNVTLP